MDKETLSNYGWIVIAVLVLAVMIALATPFGKYIQSSTENTLFGLINTSDNALDIIIKNQNTNQENTQATPQCFDLIKDGDYIFAYYGCETIDEMRDAFMKSTIYSETGEIFTSWNSTKEERIEKVASINESYVDFILNEFDAESKFNQFKNLCDQYGTDGWFVHSTVQDKTKTSYVDIKEEYRGITVTVLTGLFANCTNLETAPLIPKTVKHMDRTFEGCTSLTGTIRIPCHISDDDIATWTGCTATVDRYCYDGCIHSEQNN